MGSDTSSSSQADTSQILTDFHRFAPYPSFITLQLKLSIAGIIGQAIGLINRYEEIIKTQQKRIIAYLAK